MTQNELITMTKKEARRYEVIKDLESGKIDGTEAALALNLSVRQIKRIKKKVKTEGIKGVIHANRGRASHNQINPQVIRAVRKLLHRIYNDFNPLLAQEHLRDDDEIDLSLETVRKIMIDEKLWTPKKKSDQRTYRWRERFDNYGQMQQFDGSYHNWFEGRNEAELGLEQCLLLSVDDATGKPTKAKFEAHEGVVPVLRFWKEYFEQHGTPVSIYLDKFSTYKVNHKNAVDNKDMMTQFERAMKQLDVRVIHANTPQAKGRVEKMNHTFQRRLVKEMRLAKINTIAEANRFLNDVFIPKFNKQFAVVPKKSADLHRKLNKKQLHDLSSIMSIHTNRTILNDYTVRIHNKYFQLEEIQPTTVYKRAKVIVEEWATGEIKICYKGKYLKHFELPAKPQKEIDIKLIALTPKKSTAHVPPMSHPWKQAYRFKQLTNSSILPTTR